MKFRIWAYFFKNAFLNISGNRVIHMISMGTISISMLLFGAFMFLSVNLNNWIEEWGKSLSMSIYLTDGYDEKIKGNIEEAILSIPGAEITGFVSKEEAMEKLVEGLGEQAGLLHGLKSNPLPGSFEVVFRDSDEYRIDPKEIKVRLEKIEGVDEVQYSEQWVEQFEGVMYMFKVAGLIIGGLLCLAVLFITTNTIKLAIYSRRDEIEIYKLVGATDWFVKMPFIIEGAIQGLVSGIFSVIILVIAYLVFSFESFQVFGLPLFTITFLSLKNILFIIFLSLFLGFAGGIIAIGRFFRI